MSDPACRNYRELLGVYVVGAIEPNERGLLDAHLKQCYGCREELAGLAVLPALLHRIPVAEAERLVHPGDPDDPAPDVLSRLLSDVRARRQSKRLRGAILAAAAAVIVAASGSVVVSDTLSEHSHPGAVQLERIFNSQGPVSGAVKYGPSPWGTAIWARVRGVPEWTECKLWVDTAHGHSVLVAGWLVGPGSGDLWYPSRIDVPARSIRGFTVKSAGKVLVSIPAS